VRTRGAQRAAEGWEGGNRRVQVSSKTHSLYHTVNKRRIKGTQGGQKLTLRAFTFKDGNSEKGGGLSVEGQSLVDLVLCLFICCAATSAASGFGGGGILVEDALSTANIYATRFIGNAAASGTSGDILVNGGSVMVGSTCPSPYQDFGAVTEGVLATEGLGSDPTYSYYCYFSCPASYYNPDLGPR
jgi:hypothetical protein